MATAEAERRASKTGPKPGRKHRQLTNLRQLRGEAGLTLAELAEEAGMSRDGLYQLERLNRLSRPESRQRIAKALGVKVSALYEEANDER